MILNHINLPVIDVPATVAMFETHFGLRRAEGMPVTSKMAFMIDDGGLFVSLFKAPDATYPKMFHIGFIRPTAAEVLAIREELNAAGFSPEEPRAEHGRFTFYFASPGGFTVEVNSFDDAEP